LKFALKTAELNADFKHKENAKRVFLKEFSTKYRTEIKLSIV